MKQVKQIIEFILVVASCFFRKRKQQKSTPTFLKILILLALVMEEKEIALAALGVIVTLSQRLPPDNPTKGTSLPASETKEPTEPPPPPEPPTCLAGA